MPLYNFTNIVTQEVKDFLYSMKEAPKVGSIIEAEGGKWKRNITTSQIATAGISPLDPYSAKDFATKTGNMKGNVGNMWDLSKELSERRAAKEGADPVKQAYYKDYSKKHKGRKHISEKKEGHDAAIKELNTKLKKFDVKIGLA